MKSTLCSEYLGTSPELYRPMNFIVLLAKNFILRQKLFLNASLDLTHFLRELRQKLAMEKLISTQTNRPDKFHQWNAIYNALGWKNKRTVRLSLKCILGSIIRHLHTPWGSKVSLFPQNKVREVIYPTPYAINRCSKPRLAMPPNLHQIWQSLPGLPLTTTLSSKLFLKLPRVCKNRDRSYLLFPPPSLSPPFFPHLPTHPLLRFIISILILPSLTTVYTVKITKIQPPKVTFIVVRSKVTCLCRVLTQGYQSLVCCYTSKSVYKVPRVLTSCTATFLLYHTESIMVFNINYTTSLYAVK